MKYLLLIVVSVALLVGQANAAFIVVPNSLETTEGGSNNHIPFNRTDTRYQQVFGSSQFGSDPIFISEVAFRPDANPSVGYAFSVTHPNVRISLSTTSAGPDSLSTTFADNVGGDDLVVFSGSLSLSSSFLGTAPKAFDISIPFSSSFLYNPSSGNNLLLDVTIFSGLSGAPAFDAGSYSMTDEVSRVLSEYSSSAATGTADTGGLVARFDTQVVPIPGAVWLLGSGLIGLVSLKRKFKK